MPARHSTALLAVHRQVDGVRLGGFGSGVLLRIRDYHFLISAAHVLTGDQLWLPGKPFLPLDESGRIFSTTPFDPVENKTHNDLLDCGYVLLNPAAVTAITAIGRTFLDLDAVALKTTTATVGVFSGFPASKTSARPGAGIITSTPTYIKGPLLSDAELQAHGCDPRIHLGIHYHRQMVAEDTTTQRVNGPEPHGMSGGAVWLVEPDAPPLLCGIGVSYDEQKHILFGSRLRPLLGEFARKYFAESEPTNTPSD